MARRDEQKETYTVAISRDLKTGIVFSEIWMNDRGEVHRPLADGPAMILRDPGTGELSPLSGFYLENKEINPETEEVKSIHRPLRKHKPYKPRSAKPKPA
jgi:hypothetical protein